jgi:peptidyl-dipeptidase Dcp
MSEASSNPLLREWTTVHGTPPFPEIRPEHFREALPVALDAHKAEIAGLVDSPEPPTFENTIARFDRSGALLKKVRDVFHNLCASCTSTELQAVELDFAGPLAAHDSHIYMSGLYSRIAPIYERREFLGLNPEQTRLVEVLHLDFVRAGAKFDESAKARYSKLMERLAVLNTQFTQNIVADESDFVIPLTEADLDGVPDFLKAACRSAAEERGGKDGAYVVTLSRSLVVPFLTSSPRRDLREKAW